MEKLSYRKEAANPSTNKELRWVFESPEIRKRLFNLANLEVKHFKAQSNQTCNEIEF